MKSYKIRIHKKAFSYLKKLGSDEKERIKRKLEILSEGKFKKLSVLKMSGEWEGYLRFRVGKYRVIFRIIDDTIYVDYIGARGDIYK